MATRATAGKGFVANPTKIKVDELAKVRAQISALKEKEEQLKLTLLPKLQAKGFLEGYAYRVELSCYDQRSISRSKLERYMTPAQITRCTNVTPVEKLVFTSKENKS